MATAEPESWAVEEQQLLDELAAVYQQIEQVLAGAERDRHLTYDELRRCNAALQDRLADLETAHRRLQDAQWLLLRAEQMSAMGQLAAALVHEINAPLTVIGANLELLLMEEQEQDKLDDLETALQANWSLRDLARHVLHFARQRQAACGTVDLNHLAREVLALFAPLIRKVDVETRLADDLGSVRADPAQLEQALANLVSNALDALDGGGRGCLCIATGAATPDRLIAAEEAAGWHTALAIGMEPAARQAVWSYVEVRDNGPGIAPEVMSRIFETFVTTKGADRGAGLGLAISRSIAEAHGGDLLVAAQLGGGASFRLLLPMDSATGTRISDG
jgi:signal transduction histidine kinase